MNRNQRTIYTHANVDCDRIKELFDDGSQFAILIHRHPDGDAICSAVALYRILVNLGKTARICCADPLPEYLTKLCPVGVEKDPVFGENEFLIAVDVAELSLLGGISEQAENKGVWLKLDHHRTGSDFAKYNMVDPDASAAGEIIYRLAMAMGMDDQDILLSCYGAIASDTGGFRYANATAGAFEAAADMRRRGISFEDVNGILFESKDYKTLTATAHGIANTVFYFENRAAIFAVTRQEMIDAGFDDENMAELPSALREIRGVCMSVVMREEKGGGSYRVSTRSDKNADCTALCGAFGGGGHLRAAGATLKADSKEAAIAMILAELEKQFVKE
ncbi:MAG: hypothetical protein E7616_01735 [Ruminococcaceae bacterium]|nr:hypothetical protein [Oscillospiraceae bacterium]